MRYFNRDISWLGFNGKVLEEAANPDNPLYERIKFLSIFSSNLDEFFRVRYPALHTQVVNTEYASSSAEVQATIRKQLDVFGAVLTTDLLPRLQEHKVSLVYNEPLPAAVDVFTSDYFYTRVLTFLQPVILNESAQKIELENNELYFIVCLKDATGAEAFAIVNIPEKHLSRFIELPSENGIQLIFIDDVLRHYMQRVFPSWHVSGCYSIKMTRSADIDITDEWSDMFEEEVLVMMQKRERGVPTRLLYESGMPETCKTFIQQYFDITERDMVAGGRYHNMKDLVNLPIHSGKDLVFTAQPPCRHKGLDRSESIFEAIETGDQLLHFPYHSYSYVLRFFNEAAIDPEVEEVSATLYRVAADSFITNALISAARNGKKVTAFVELKARFDESNNLSWAKKMKEAGVKIIYSIPDMKVHAKIALVKKKTDAGSRFYGLFSTGNFNERTARFYTDHLLMTAKKEMTREIDLLFAYLQARQKPDDYSFLNFQHLIVAGFNFRQRMQELVEREIENKRQHKQAHITIKVNNLQEPEMIELLYKASNAGVQVDLLVRGICCLVPGVPGMSEHISVRKLVGRYLEHSRIYRFCNNGNEEVYAGSADLMARNIFRRIEVLFPISDAGLREQINQFLGYQLADNTQTSLLSNNGSLLPVGRKDESINAQNTMYEYVQHL